MSKQDLPDGIRLTEPQKDALEVAARGEASHDPQTFSFGFVNPFGRSSKPLWWLWRAGLITFGVQINERTVMMEPTALGWATLGNRVSPMCSPPRMLGSSLKRRDDASA
jgi:hypothetical protein